MLIAVIKNNLIPMGNGMYLFLFNWIPAFC